MSASPWWAGDDRDDPALAEAIAKLQYLTPQDKFGIVGRGNPPPHKLPPEKRRAVGLDRETWQLELVPDPETDTKLERPLSKEHGTALNWQGLMQLAEKHAVRYLKVMTCNNGNEPLGMGLWEGVPLREIIWMTRPVENMRRLFYYGYHNDDPKQIFQSSLPIGRVLEDPPGHHPVLLCYKLNGQWLSPDCGGPARIIVPEAYGFKNVKWLQRIVLTNLYHANDTYAGGNNDIDSAMKTCARFINPPKTVKLGQPIPLVGLAQVGLSGLSKVQVWLQPEGTGWPADDPHFTKAPWQDANILPPPERWGGEFADGNLSPTPLQFDIATGKPHQWPLRYTIAHWATLLKATGPGKYLISCRTIDAAGHAQPMPRPFPKSGRVGIQRVSITVEA